VEFLYSFCDITDQWKFHFLRMKISLFYCMYLMYHGLKCKLTMFGIDLRQMLLKYINLEPCHSCGQTDTLCAFLLTSPERKQSIWVLKVRICDSHII
jgi:hypothetical protein